jgi:hypothetical protein
VIADLEAGGRLVTADKNLTRGWWLSTMLDLMTSNWFGVRSLSAEEKTAIRRIALFWMLTFVALDSLGELGFRRSGIKDDLDIHVGVVFGASVILSVWLGRRIFVWLYPKLSHIADEKAGERLATQYKDQ